MKTVGEILKKRRLEKNLSLEEVGKTTKIRKKYLFALEENDFSSLPAFTFSRGFLKNYSEYLGLPANDLIAIFRRQTKEEKEQELLPSGIRGTQDKSPLKINPKIGAILIGAITFGIFIFYLYFQLLSYFGKPYLKVYYPKKNLTAKTEVIEIKGKTDPEGRLFINNQEVSVFSNGEFFEKITLNKGENTITIVAKNKAGKENKKIVIINYK